MSTTGRFAILANVAGNGSGTLPWSVEAAAILGMTFICTQCQEYVFSAFLTSDNTGTLPFVLLEDAGFFTITEANSPGNTFSQGRLAPGLYRFYGSTQVRPGTAAAAAGLLSTQLSVTDCPASVPLNVLLSKLAKFGPYPASYGVGVGVYLDSPSGGPEWKVRGVVILLLPAGK